jgi:hypothetical protein
MDEKFFPGKETLRTLQREGIVPWSKGATRCAILAASVAVIFPLAARMPWDRGQLIDAAFSPQGIYVVLSIASTAIAVTAAVAVLVSLFVTLVQTRLTLVASLLIPKFREPERASVGSVVGSVGLAALAASGLLFFYWGDLLGLLRRDPRMLVADVTTLGTHAGKLLIGIAGIGLILVGAGAQFRFLMANRVSRRERESGE